MVAEGEHERQDFKFAVSDARKIARSVSAFANRDGGRLLIGVKDNGTIAGVRNEEDAYVVETAASIYCRPAVPVSFHAYSVDTGIRVIVAEIAPCATRPVAASEPDGTWRAWYRVADENIAAHPLMVRAWQRAADGIALVLTDSHASLLRLLDARGELPADSRSLAVALHISGHAAAEAAVELAAAGVLTFVHTRAGFMLRRPEN